MQLIQSFVLWLFLDETECFCFSDATLHTKYFRTINKNKEEKKVRSTKQNKLFVFICYLNNNIRHLK